MPYELNAEGMNGVHFVTTVVALDPFKSEFDISVWKVDAISVPAIGAIGGLTSGGKVPVRGQSTLDGVGVRGEVMSGTGEGVQGQGSGNPASSCGPRSDGR